MKQDQAHLAVMASTISLQYPKVDICACLTFDVFLWRTNYLILQGFPQIILGNLENLHLKDDLLWVGPMLHFSGSYNVRNIAFLFLHLCLRCFCT